VGLALLASLLPACMPMRGGWDVHELEGRQPQLARYAGHRLGDVPPHFVADGDGVALFLCRWETPARLAVSLPPDADSREGAVLKMALSAWQQAGLGLSFESVGPDSAQIELRFADPARDGWAPEGSGDTIADCLVDAETHRADGVSARLVFASIYLRRTSRDALERERPLSDEELLAVALHEIGHALGHAGHAARGGSLMERAPERARRAARRVLAGEGLAEPSLAALYAIESGTEVGRLPLPPESACVLARMSERARRAGWRGPLARVGDREARLLWRAEAAADARSVAFADVARWREVVRGRAPFSVATDPETRAWLRDGAASSGRSPGCETSP
jgi:hypothetical protein